MMFSQFTFLWIIFAIVDSHSLLTEKKAEDGISVKSEIVINNLQNQINQETVIRLSLLKQVYSLVNDMINVKNEMAAMKTNTAEIRKSTDDLRHEDNKMLNEIAQMKQDHNNTSEIIINEQNEHDKMLSEIKQKMKINQNDTSERIINYKREYEKIFSEIEQKMKFDHKDTSERIAKAQLEYKTMFKKFEQNMKSNQDDTSERIVNIKKDLLNVNNSVGLLHNYTDKINSKYGIQEKTVRDLVSELGKIQGRLGVLHNESERLRSETQRVLVNYNETTLKMRDDLQNITSMVNDLNSFQFQDCLESSHCWLLYSFDYDDSWNGCEGGAQYVKKTNYSTTPYLGVMTCSSTRYKLFLSRTVIGKYYNIGDGSGNGQDHCELLGSSKEGVLPGTYFKAPNTQGFHRDRRGQQFSFGNVGYLPKRTTYFLEKWIECGVSIPGSDRVISL